MSRVATPPQAQPTFAQAKVPHDRIAMRAYEKWCQRGQPQGTDLRDWLEAETELRSEFSRTPSPTPAPARR